jgi:hypothetical protein
MLKPVRMRGITFCCLSWPLVGVLRILLYCCFMSFVSCLVISDFVSLFDPEFKCNFYLDFMVISSS